jgi:hypothetical protein
MSDMSIITDPLLVLLVLFLLVRIALGQLNERSRKVSVLWIMPVLMIYISYAAIVQDIFPAFYAAPLIFLSAIAIGCIIGLVRGSMVSMRLDGSNDRIIMKGSVVGLLIWGTMIVLRYTARYALGSMADSSIIAMTLSALIVLSLSSSIFYTGYLYFRYYGLLKKGGVKDNNIL